MVAILVLVLWLFTAGAGFSVLISSNLKRDRSVPSAQLAPTAASSTAPSVRVAPNASVRVAPNAPAVPAAPGASGSASQQDERRAYRERFDPPSLVAARNAPVVPGARALLEFSHPACGIIGLAFWLGFSLVHARVLGWIGFGLAAVTACAGLTWFAVNLGAARRHAQSESRPAPNRHEPNRHEPPRDVPAPSFRGRLVALHGAAAALTLLLAALAAVVLHG
jgi:hypothetical protein